ncbi:hypothetical protein IWX90DRAFT_420429 [Phyllosticta citrichinensis]|uniref:DUF7707 domain-containing protein n=1 Tax=Phyllosticta citrichinensis TaxID=1130410 RepID=A0ABR1Y669_9PEZI
MRVSTVFAAVSAFGLALAQSSTGATCQPSSTVEPSSVDSTQRNTWCRAQQQSCPTLCGGSTANNTCDIETLTYNCTCSPAISNLNISDFSQTLPSLECQYAVGQCTQAHPDDATCQSVCQSVVCGSKNVTSQAETSSSSAVASATGTPTSSGTASTASTTAAASSSAAAAAVAFGSNFGSASLIAGLLALFSLAL